MTPAELNVHLKAALDDEDYELAARIRDELNKRK
jgi:protein-arginine kinase activator protein McsA